MNAQIPDLDAAWRQVVGARARSDGSAEARSLALLAQALHLEGRSKEAFAIGQEVIDRFQHCPGFRRESEMKISRGLREGTPAIGDGAVGCGLRAEIKARHDLAVARGAIDVFGNPKLPGAAMDWGRVRSHCARRCQVERDVLVQLHEMLMQWGALQEDAARREEAEEAEYRAYRGLRPIHESDSDMFRGAHSAYSQALAALNALADAPESLKEEARKRAMAVAPPKPRQLRLEVAAAAAAAPEAVAATVIAGFLAVKAVGPFLEAWATKLGELAGESTARMLGRMHVRRTRHRRRSLDELPEDRTRLVADLPNIYLTAILPRHMSDAAKLALIDINPADLLAAGAIQDRRITQDLYWCANAGAWLSQQKRAARGCPNCQHPECSPI